MNTTGKMIIPDGSPAIDFLHNHAHFTECLATWHYNEWKHLYRDWTFEQAFTDLASHGTSTVPQTLIALHGNDVIGSVSILDNDLEISHNLRPWLANLFVKEEYRGRGIGKKLIESCLSQAKLIGITTLYLHTTEKVPLYLKMGWRPLHRIDIMGYRTTIMEKDI